MPDKIDLILSKLESIEKNMNEQFTQVNSRLGKLEINVVKLESSIDKLKDKEQEHFEFLLDEYGKVYNDLDKRITILE